MYISSTAPAAVSAPQPTAPDAGSALATLQALASVILDASGQASEADKLDAYDSSSRLSATGQYRGVGQDGARLLNQIGNSATAQQVEAQRARYSDAMMTAIQKAGAAGVPRSQALGAAALQHFDSLARTDQQALFSSLNAPDRTGVTPFAGVDDWRGQMATMGGAAGPVDKVSLSDAAKALVGDRGPAAPQPAPYVTGSVASVRA
jgi:hypothetical protein